MLSKFLGFHYVSMVSRSAQANEVDSWGCRFLGAEHFTNPPIILIFVE
jgi:hypothetical protein